MSNTSPIIYALNTVNNIPFPITAEDTHWAKQLSVKINQTSCYDKKELLLSIKAFILYF